MAVAIIVSLVMLCATLRVREATCGSEWSVATACSHMIIVELLGRGSIAGRAFRGLLIGQTAVFASS